MSYSIEPGNHDCDTPDYPEKFCSELESNDGKVAWTCEECDSLWVGKSSFSKSRGHWGHALVWKRYRSSTKRCSFAVPWGLLVATVICVELLVIAVP